MKRLKEILMEIEIDTNDPIDAQNELKAALKNPDKFNKQQLNKSIQKQREIQSNNDDPLKPMKLRIERLRQQLIAAEEDLKRREEALKRRNGITEAKVVRQYKNYAGKLVKKYRCLEGPKKGKLVSNPSDCSKRKDPKKVRKGKQIMRAKKGTIIRKSQISKRRSISKILQKLNAKLMGKR